MAPISARSRLGNRKSELPDAALYQKPYDDSDEDDGDRVPTTTFPPTTTSSTTRIATTATTTKKALPSKHSASAPAPAPAPASRRSGRLSNGSSTSDSPARALPPTRRVKKGGDQPPKGKATTGGRTNQKGKKEGERAGEDHDDAVMEDEEDAGDGDAGHQATSTTTATRGGAVPSTSKRPYEPAAPKGAKKPKPNPKTVAEPAFLSSSSTRPTSAFVPRAAGQVRAAGRLVAKSLFTNGDGDDDSDAAIPFSTEPPTPYTAPSAKRSAASAAEGARQSKMPRTDGTTKPKPAMPTTPERGARDSDTPTLALETPTIIKNIRMRNGEMGTPGRSGGGPGSSGGSARRSSVRSEQRGQRGSSIGSGYEAVPHPDVPDDKLYRSTEPNMPIARRLRTILSWVTQRQRDKTFPSSAAPQDPTVAFAKDVVEDFIKDITGSNLDTSVKHEAPAAGPSAASSSLPPHPQNVANAAKMAELQATTAKINDEFNARNVVLTRYQDFEAQCQASPAILPALPTSLKLDSTVSAPSTMEEALALGHSLALGEESGGVVKKSGKKGKGKEVEDATAERPEIVAMRLRTAEFKRLTHQLNEFTLAASSYVESRKQQTHDALSADSNRGLVPVSQPISGGEGTIGGIASVVRGANSGLTPIPTEPTTSRGPDPRDLLRAISHADMARQQRRPQ